jgi:hypothetical protein
MTTDTQTVTECPQCGKAPLVPMAGNVRFCPFCRWEGDPAVTAALVTDTEAELGADVIPLRDVTDPDMGAFFAALADPADQILGPPAEIVELEASYAQIEAMKGTQVVLEGGQLATIIDFPDNDRMEVRLSADDGTPYTTVVDLNDVVRSIDAPPPTADISDEQAEELTRTYNLIGHLGIRAGLATIVGEGDEAELLTPPNGWIPDNMAVPALEQGIGYMVANLMRALRIPRVSMETVALAMLDASQAIPTEGEGETE